MPRRPKGYGGVQATPAHVEGKHLTIQQEMVLDLLSQGLSYSQVATKMDLKPKSVQQHYQAALDRIPDLQVEDLPPNERRAAVTQWWLETGRKARNWEAARTPEQNQARAGLMAMPPPAGWPDVQCRRHPHLALVLGVGGGPWCGLCLKELAEGELTHHQSYALVDKGRAFDNNGVQSSDLP